MKMAPLTHDQAIRSRIQQRHQPTSVACPGLFDTLEPTEYGVPIYLTGYVRSTDALLLSAQSKVQGNMAGHSRPSGLGHVLQLALHQAISSTPTPTDQAPSIPLEH